MAGASKTDIFNAALTLLELDSVDNADNSPQQGAIVLRKNYELRRKAVMRAHPWNFAIARWSGIAAEPAAPAFEFAKAFKKPADCLRVIELADPEEPFRVETGADDATIIVTDASAPLAFRGIKDITNTARFDDNFVEAFAADLAWWCSKKLNASEDLRAGAKKLRDGIIASARSIDGQEGTLPSIFEDSFLSSRYWDDGFGN